MASVARRARHEARSGAAEFHQRRPELGDQVLSTAWALDPESTLSVRIEHQLSGEVHAEQLEAPSNDELSSEGVSAFDQVVGRRALRVIGHQQEIQAMARSQWHAGTVATQGIGEGGPSVYDGVPMHSYDPFRLDLRAEPEPVQGELPPAIRVVEEEDDLLHSARFPLWIRVGAVLMALGFGVSVALSAGGPSLLTHPAFPAPDAQESDPELP